MSSRVRQKAKKGLSRISDLLKGKSKRDQSPKIASHVSTTVSPTLGASEGNNSELNKCPTRDVFQPIWSSNPPAAPTSPIRTADLLRPLPPLFGNSSDPLHLKTADAGAAASSQARKPAVRRRTVTVEDALDDDEAEVHGGGETEAHVYGAYHLVRGRVQFTYMALLTRGPAVDQRGEVPRRTCVPCSGQHGCSGGAPGSVDSLPLLRSETLRQTPWVPHVVSLPRLSTWLSQVHRLCTIEPR